MAAPSQSVRPSARLDAPFLLLSTALVLSLLRARDQPGLDVTVAGSEVTIVPADLALLALLAVCLQVLRREGRAALPPGSPLVLGAAAAFAGWLLATALANGADALVSGARLTELWVLALGVVLLVRDTERLRLLVWTLVLFTFAAGAGALVGFVQEPGSRQASFVGEHDLAALGTLAVAVGLAARYVPGHGWRRLPLAAGVAGTVCIVLGAALASLLGLYLVVGTVALVAVARHTFRWQALAVGLAVAALTTAATLELRSGDLGFLNEWFGVGEEATEPGRYAGGWSQRLIYSYIGIRVFADNPIAGTGWHGNLPSGEFARFLDDARERFADQPARYFPRADGELVPQQAYDQVLFELGLVGAALFLVLAVAVAARAARGALSWPRAPRRELGAYVAAAWVAAMAGALSGSALFGGSPLITLMWLTIGAAGAAPGLALAAGGRSPVAA